MSKIALSGNPSGTGTFTIASPNSNTDRTLTLPDATGTVQVSGNPISGTTGTFTGLLNISAAGAGQIQFPATQNPSANANTLDDYEEGTFTPIFANYSGQNIVGAYDQQHGRYTKIGRQVNCTLWIVTAASWAYQNGATTSTPIAIGGLPFVGVADGVTYPSASCGSYTSLNGWSAGYTPMGYLDPGTNIIRLAFANTNSTAAVTAALISSANSQMLFSITYFTA